MCHPFSVNNSYICIEKSYITIVLNNEITACFTGHRTYKGTYNKELEDAIRRLYADGYRTFMSGMAVGFDLAAAEMVLALRNELKGISLIAVIPFEGMEQRFSEEDKARFATILAKADDRVILAPRYSSELYALRNNYLVDNSSAVIAYFDGSKGGTAYTVRRAVKSLHRYINLYQSAQQSLEF